MVFLLLNFILILCILFINFFILNRNLIIYLVIFEFFLLLVVLLFIYAPFIFFINFYLNQTFIIYLLTLFTCETGVGLTILLNIFKLKNNLNQFYFILTKF